MGFNPRGVHGNPCQLPDYFVQRFGRNLPVFNAKFQPAVRNLKNRSSQQRYRLYELSECFLWMSLLHIINY